MASPPPPQNNIQQVFQRLHASLQEEYGGEDLQIIACPSMEQVPDSVLMITSKTAESDFKRQITLRYASLSDQPAAVCE